MVAEGGGGASRKARRQACRVVSPYTGSMRLVSVSRNKFVACITYRGRKHGGGRRVQTDSTYSHLRAISDLQKQAENIRFAAFEQRRLVLQHFPQDDQPILEFFGILIEYVRTRAICIEFGVRLRMALTLRGSRNLTSAVKR